MTKGQPTTCGIKHWGISGYANILPRINFCVTGQESSPQSATFNTADIGNHSKKDSLLLLDKFLMFN